MNVVVVPDRPRSLTIAGGCWLVAIGAGAFETVLAAAHALITAEMTASTVLAQVLFRLLVFTLACWLTRQLLRGRNSARIALTVLLSVLGLLSLLIAPIEWLTEGHPVMDALRHLDAYDVAFRGSRVVHVLAVLVATVAMYRPEASRYISRAGGLEP